jgi:hypothetical protein
MLMGMVSSPIDIKGMQKVAEEKREGNVYVCKQ